MGKNYNAKRKFRQAIMNAHVVNMFKAGNKSKLMQAAASVEDRSGAAAQEHSSEAVEPTSQSKLDVDAEAPTEDSPSAAEPVQVDEEPEATSERPAKLDDEEST